MADHPACTLLIAGEALTGEGRDTADILDPATGEAIGSVPHATAADLDREIHWLSQAFEDRATVETRSRLIVERMALALQASTLLRAGNSAVSDAFCASRLGGGHGLVLGTLTGMCNKLPQEKFVRIHRSYIVNRDKIRSIHTNKVQLDGCYLPVGKIYRSVLETLLN